ncbi:MAG: hypothetical protein N3A62_10285 [Thermodesulfovibrionales bacterium]|nr:hypothetical protein [Thermodesulfovibrionales bacterium]
MNTVEIYNLKQLKEALKKEPKPVLEIKDPMIASAVSLYFRQRNTGFSTMSIISGGCLTLSPILEVIIVILSIAGMILLDKYYIHPEDKDRKWYDVLKDFFTFKYPYIGTPPYPPFMMEKMILKPKHTQEDK